MLKLGSVSTSLFLGLADVSNGSKVRRVIATSTVRFTVYGHSAYDNGDQRHSRIALKVTHFKPSFTCVVKSEKSISSYATFRAQ